MIQHTAAQRADTQLQCPTSESLLLSQRSSWPYGKAIKLARIFSLRQQISLQIHLIYIYSHNSQSLCGAGMHKGTTINEGVRWM